MRLCYEKYLAMCSVEFVTLRWLPSNYWLTICDVYVVVKPVFVCTVGGLWFGVIWITSRSIQISLSLIMWLVWLKITQVQCAVLIRLDLIVCTHWLCLQVLYCKYIYSFISIFQSVYRLLVVWVLPASPEPLSVCVHLMNFCYSHW